MLGDDQSTVPACYVCPICAAHGKGLPPHGWDAPCPQKLRLDEAYMTMLEAQRMSYVRSGAGMSDFGAALRGIANLDDEDSA